MWNQVIQRKWQKRTSDNRSGNPFKMGCPVRTPRKCFSFGNWQDLQPFLRRKGCWDFVTPMNLTELHFPDLQHEINQVYTAELLCELKLCSGLQQTLINVIILYFFPFRLGHATYEVLFFRLGLNPCPLHWEVSLNHQITRDVSNAIITS